MGLRGEFHWYKSKGVPSWLPNVLSPSISPWKIRARNKVNVQRSWAILKFNPVKHPASLACVSSCSPLLCCCIQAPAWSLLLGTTLPGFRSCNPPWLRLSQWPWGHKPLRRQSLSPWEGGVLPLPTLLYPAWPWAWPVSQWQIRFLKGGTT